MIQLKKDKPITPFERLPRNIRDQILAQRKVFNSIFGLNYKTEWREAKTTQVTEDIEFEDVTHKRLGDGKSI
jgi:hypothetical protein